MGQPAYDMSSEVRRRKAPQTQRKVALRVEKGGKRRLNPVQAAMQHLLQLISMALLAGPVSYTHLLDQVKEAMFSIVQFDLPGARVLDLYAGSGQLGIEALSRRCV